MTTMTRISKRDENVKNLGTPSTSQNGLSGDAGPSPPAITTSQTDNHNGDDLKCSLFIVDTKDPVDSSSEHARLGGNPSSEYGPKQLPVRSGDPDPYLPAANPGVAYESSSADEFGSGSPLFSPLFSPIDLPQPGAAVKPQASSTPTLLAPSSARGEVQATETSVPRPSQSSIQDNTSLTTAVAGPTAKRLRPASVQGLLPVCALDIDFFSAKPRAASAPLFTPLDSSSPQTQHASSSHEIKQNLTANASSANSGRQKRKPTGSAVDKDRSPSFTTYVEPSVNAPDPPSADPGSSVNRMFNGRSKQTLTEVAIPVTPAPLLENSAPTTFATTPLLPKMSEEDEREIARIIEISVQKTGLFTAPKELIARSRREKRKRDKNAEAMKSATSPDAAQPAISEHSSTTTDPLTEAPAPKPKRKRTTKPKKVRAIMANPYPRTTTTPPDEVPQQEYPFNAQQVQRIPAEVSPTPMPVVNPDPTTPMNDSRSNGRYDPAPSLAVHGNTFSTNVIPTHGSAFQHTQSTAPGPTPYLFNIPRNLDINHPQGTISSAVHPARPTYNPASMNLQRLFWQRAQIARQMQARRQAGFVDQRYHAPFIPNAMSMPVTSSGWNPQAPSLPSQLSMDAGLPYLFDDAHSTQGVSAQPRTQSNVYTQYQVPNFDHNMQSSPYQMQHPLFNQAPAGPSQSLQSNIFNPPSFNPQLTPPAGYELPFSPIQFGSERQREADYMTRPAFPAVRAPMQSYSHSLDPSLMNHTVAPIGLHDDPTTRGQIPVPTSSRLHPTLPGPFIGDELTNATQ